MKTKRNKKPDHPYASYKKGEKPKEEKQERRGRKEKNWSIQTETDGTFTIRQDIFTKINDEELIIGKRQTLFSYVLFFLQICLIVTMIGFFVYFIYKAINDFSFVYLVLILLLLYPLIPTILDAISDYMNLASHDILILNRLKGTVTLHEYRFLNKETTIYPFGKIEIEVCYLEKIYVRNNKNSNPKVPVLCISGKNPWFLTTLFEIREDKKDCYISFFVWYMDKNRPLPPHSFFDPYREKDYKRRKAEGFPPPLYPSEIHIPEYKEE